MGIPVFILGESGSGKSTSLRNLSESEATIFGVAGKPLPFKKKLDYIAHANYSVIGAELKRQTKKIYVIDDSQYLLAFDLFDKAKELGYGKFTDIAVRFKKMLDNQLTLEGLFSIVLFANNLNNEYVFETQTDGFTTAKSPMGMFQPKIPNDLKFVDTVIREYWGL